MNPMFLLHAFTFSLALLSFLTAQSASARHPLLSRILGEDSLVDAAGDAVNPSRVLRKKYVFIYFSGSFCKPCRLVTPHLTEFHRNSGGPADFEFILVDQDPSMEHMKRYMQREAMPWVGLRLKDPAIAEIERHVGWTRGFPMLYLLDEEDGLVARPAPQGTDHASWNPVKVWQRVHGLPETHWDFATPFQEMRAAGP